jgi:hypothetical protein
LVFAPVARAPSIMIPERPEPLDTGCEQQDTAEAGGRCHRQPVLIIGAPSGSWDLGQATKIAVPVSNSSSGSVRLSITVVSGPPDHLQSFTSPDQVELSPGQEMTIVMPFGRDTLALEMGMRSGPTPRGAIKGSAISVAGPWQPSFDTRRVVALRLVTQGADDCSAIVVGSVQTIEPESRAEFTGMVDSFGQYVRGNWPEKIGSDEELASQTAAADSASRAAAPLADSGYGGLTSSHRIAATGFFRLERRNGRWWLVAPNGSGFFSLGVNGVSPSGGATYIEGRKSMFTSLPPYAGPLSEFFGHGSTTQGTQVQAGRKFAGGTWFNFLGANLKRAYGPDWREIWATTTIDRLRSWGFNTLGGWSTRELAGNDRIASTVTLNIGGTFARISDGVNWWGPMPDPFDPAFATAVDATVSRSVGATHRDPLVIGYFVDNELGWGSQNGDWRHRYALAIHTLAGGDGFAKRAFIDLLKQIYGTPSQLADRWNIGVPPDWFMWNARSIILPDRPTPDLLATLQRFSATLAAKYYEIVSSSIHRYAPDQLYLGSRFGSWTKEAVEACARWCDVLSFNVYAHTPEERGAPWRPYDRPVMITEFHFGSSDRGPFWAGMVDVGSEAARGPAYRRYSSACGADPDIVGCHWFTYYDEPITGRRIDGENGHIGLVAVTGLPWATFTSEVAAANALLLRDLSAKF